jgi:hydroxymethylbilane synthase
MRKKITIGSRGSKLALIQANSVALKLKGIYPHAEISILKVVTKGDRDQQSELDNMEADVFVKELDEALLNNEIDIAVHSLKDVPVTLSAGLCLIAITERLDPRDVLVSKSIKLDEFLPGSRIGTSSLRRSSQLTHYRSDLRICSVRGNVDTRVDKVYSGEIDGLVTASAAMIRLKEEGKITEYLSTSHFLPAAGQGAIAIEARIADKEIKDMLSPANYLPAWQSTMAERAFLNTLGAGCHTSIAALGVVKNKILRLDAMVASPDHAEEIGIKLAQKMIKQGALKLIRGGSLN